MFNYFTYLIVLLLSFFGVFAGGILALIAPEELKAGEKYWKAAKYIFIFLIIAAVFYFSLKYSNMTAAILISIALIFLKIANREYPALAFVLFFSAALNENFLFLVASLIFVYGLFIGTLESKIFIVNKLDKYKRINIKKIGMANIFWQLIKNNILYLIFGLILLPLGAYL